MQIQSLSIDVPAGCLNRCEFCVAHMRREDYPNQIEQNHRFCDLYKADYKKRLLFARDNGCNTMMITGNGEPLLNRNFLANLAEWNDNLLTPFRWIELQTSGTLLDDEYLRFLRNTVKVNTISLSLSSIFSDQDNARYNCTVLGKEICVGQLCYEIKKYDFNLRLSLNMTDLYNDKTAQAVFDRVKGLDADQVTFRVLYTSGLNTPQDQWIVAHSCADKTMAALWAYIQERGRAVQKLPFGAVKYTLDEISTVWDADCMSERASESELMKYLILRPNCKLYSRWDDKGSLVF